MKTSTEPHPTYKSGSLHIVFLAAILLSVTLACSNGQPEITILNNSDTDRIDEPVVLTRSELVSTTGNIPGGMFPLLVNDQNEPVPSQFDDTNRDGEWDELAFLVDIPAQSTLNLKVRYVAQADIPDFPRRTNVRFGVKQDSDIVPVVQLVLAADELPVPLLERFQMDGPAWENDKVGFRQYIDGRNGRDLFGKTTGAMALEHVGISAEGELVDNYHVLEPWGRDILAVGTSLGIGGVAIMHNGSPVRLGITPDAPRNNVEMTRYQLISEGPVRSVFVLTYEGWQVGHRTLNLENTVEIWAGRYRHLNTFRLQSDQSADTLVAGLVNIHNDEPLILTDTSDTGWVALATHDRQTYDKEHYLGMALILPAESYIGYDTAPESGNGITRSYNALLHLQNGGTVSYHVLAGWELSDPLFSSRPAFEQFLADEIHHIANPVVVNP
jgi:hypothetical protein